MQQIISAIIRFKNLILYLALLAFSLSFLSRRSYYHQTQLNKLSLTVSGRLYKGTNAVANYFSLKRKIQSLTDENFSLKRMDLLQKQKAILENLDNETHFPFEVRKAQIVKNSHTLARNYILINKGSKDGIAPDMGVISAKGVVGIVNQVTNNYASVISVLNNDLRINARFKDKTYFGSLFWPGTNPREMELQDIVSVYPVTVGDTLVTGGLSVYFPMGIPIGEVVNVYTPVEQGYHQIKVHLFNDPTQLDFVYVLENRDLEEIKNLIDLEEND